jgi:hypothetical protein
LLTWARKRCTNLRLDQLAVAVVHQSALYVVVKRRYQFTDFVKCLLTPAFDSDMNSRESKLSASESDRRQPALFILVEFGGEMQSNCPRSPVSGLSRRAPYSIGIVMRLPQVLLIRLCIATRIESCSTQLRACLKLRGVKTD